MLDPGTLYIILGNEDDAFPRHYIRTPDGRGCYWYDFDQREEAMNDVCEPRRVRHFNSVADFDRHRFGK